jgi:hypothetical protein
LIRPQKPELLVLGTGIGTFAAAGGVAVTGAAVFGSMTATAGGSAGGFFSPRSTRSLIGGGATGI